MNSNFKQLILRVHQRHRFRFVLYIPLGFLVFKLFFLNQISKGQLLQPVPETRKNNEIKVPVNNAVFCIWIKLPSDESTVLSWSRKRLGSLEFFIAV